MDKFVQRIYEAAPKVKEQYNDDELYELMMEVAVRLGEADMLKHQLGYLLMHARSTVAAPVRSRHFQEALARADGFLKKYEDGGS